MLHADRDALLCDLAETYHVYDFRALPVETLAALSAGLRDDSRIKMKLAGVVYISPLILQAAIADNLSVIRHWLMAKKGDNRPYLFVETMTAEAEKQVARMHDLARQSTFAQIRESVEARLKEGEEDG